VRLPVIGWVRMREPLRFRGKILSAVVSRTAERWFVSLTVEVEHHIPVRENQAAGGVDLGVSRLATFSDGAGCEGPKALRMYLAKLKRLSRSLSHKVKGSRNRRKSKARIARLYARIINIRQDALHKLTTSLARRFTTLGIEDLNVRGMMANDRLARSIADMGFYEFRPQLEYKAAMHGSRIVVADRFFASSKTCSECGSVLEALALSVPGVGLSVLRRAPRPGRERQEPEKPGGEFRRGSLWRDWLWLESRDPSETSLVEARTQRRSYPMRSFGQVWENGSPRD
jgi:putative transposase